LHVEGPHGVLGVRRAEHDVRRLGAADCLDHIEAAALAQLDIQENDVGVMRGDRGHRGFYRIRFPPAPEIQATPRESAAAWRGPAAHRRR